MDTEGWEEGEEGTKGESSTEIHALPYAKQIANGNLLYDSGNPNQGSVTTQRGGKGWDVGVRFQREATYVYL